jgi:hypothetical protein
LKDTGLTGGVSLIDPVPILGADTFVPEKTVVVYLSAS